MRDSSIDFYWDVGSTNSYFALKLIKPIVAKTRTSIVWHPFNLGFVFQKNNYVLMDEPRAKLRNRGADLERWARRYDLPFKMPANFPIKTSLALKGSIAMRQWHREAEYIEAIFNAYWENDVGTIGEIEPLRQIAESLGVDPDEFEVACKSSEVRQRMIDSTNAALALGVFGVPTIVIGNEIYWGKDRMEFIEDHLALLKADEE